MKKYLKMMGLLGIISFFNLVGCATIPDTTIENTSLTSSITDENLIPENTPKPIPYVGAAPETRRIVDFLPLPNNDWLLHSIQIGADHGNFGYNERTLTVFYEIPDTMTDFYKEHVPVVEFETNAETLFTLIENLQAITFFVNTDTKTDSDNFLYHWSVSRASTNVDKNKFYQEQCATDKTQRLFNKFTVTETSAIELIDDYLMVYYANTNATLIALENISDVDIFRLGHLSLENLSYDDLRLDPWFLPEWDKREDLIKREHLIKANSTLVLEDGIHVVMNQLGMDDYFIVVVGEEKKPLNNESQQLFNKFTITETFGMELIGDFSMVYYANTNATLTALENVSADIFRLEHLSLKNLSHDNLRLAPWSLPNWDKREAVEPTTGQWIDSELHITTGSTFVLEDGLYVVMNHLGMDEHFLIAVGDEHFPVYVDFATLTNSQSTWSSNNGLSITNFVEQEWAAIWSILHANAPATMKVTQGVTASVYRIGEFTQEDGWRWGDGNTLGSWGDVTSYPAWNKREAVYPITGQWKDTVDITTGNTIFSLDKGESFSFDEGVYLIMLYHDGIYSDHFIIMVE